MKVAIIGASGKTGRELVGESLRRGYGVVGVCRDSSAHKLDEFAGDDGFSVMTAPVVSDEETLLRALRGCDGVVAILFSVRRLKATDLVRSLAAATAANGVTRLAFTAGEVTAVREKGESYTPRQKVMRGLVVPLSWLTPYSVTDMLRASRLVREQPDWEWTIVRAPTLADAPPAGYRLCAISDVTSAHVLSRADYAACLLDSLGNGERSRRTLTVVPADGDGR